MQRLRDTYGGALAGPTRVVMHSDIQIDISIGSFKAEYRGFRVLTCLGALLFGEDRRREDFKLEPAIIELRDGVADHHVCQFADGFRNDWFSNIYFSSCEAAGDFGGGLRVHVQDDSAFDLSFESDHRGDAFLAVAIFFHREVRDGSRSFHHFRKDRV